MDTDAKENNMNILLIILVCITPLIHSAADEDPDHMGWGFFDLLNLHAPGHTETTAHEFEGAWGFSGQLVARDAVLTEEAVMNPFWQKMKNEPQEKKITTLINICEALRADYNYPERRYNIAAATYAEVDLVALEAQAKKKHCTHLVLHDAVMFKDYDLTEFLLKHKANVHEKDYDRTPIIFTAKTTLLAQLLIDFGTLKENPCCWDGDTLLHRAMWDRCEPALIPLYKKHGIDPMTCCSIGYTPLMTLAHWADEHRDRDLVINKASLLLQDLPKEKIVALINAKNNDGNTVIDIIKKSIHTGFRIRNLDALEIYLIDTMTSLETIKKAPIVKEDQTDADKPLIVYNPYIVELTKGMWAHSYLKGTTDNTQLAEPLELTEQEVMNPFWLQIKNTGQHNKDLALMQIFDAMAHYPYLTIRKDMAAAIWAGAHLLAQRSYQLSDIITYIMEKNDISLAKLVFNHNASVHEMHWGDPIIFYARTVNMAKLLFAQYKPEELAIIHNLKHSSYQGTLLHKAMDEDYEPALIPFYRAHRVSSMTTDKDGDSPLATLLKHSSKKNLLKKATLLLTGLTLQKVGLIWARNQRKKNIFDLIKDEDPLSPELIALGIFLQKTLISSLQKEECSICYDQLEPRSKEISLTQCYHAFHTECLDLWKQNSCPNCRADRTNTITIKPSDFE